MKTQMGRVKVEAILAEFEKRQAANPATPSPMDVNLIRRELGLAGKE